MYLKTNKELRVLPDIHGYYNVLEAALSEWDEEKEMLVFLGDLIDRGPDSLSVVRKVKQLVEEGKAVCIQGNHETMFLWFMQYGNGYIEYISDYVGGMDFLKNMIEELLQKGHPENELGKLDYLLSTIQKEYADIISFLKELPLYIETETFFFAHAGITVNATCIEDMKEKHFIWGEEDNLFTKVNHQYHKIVVSGHVPTFRINKTNSAIHFSENNKSIFLDGGIFTKHRISSFHSVLFKEYDKDIILIDTQIFPYADEIKVNQFKIKK